MLALVVGPTQSTVALAAGAPTSVVADDAGIELSPIGTFRGGWFSKDTPSSPPAYDSYSKRVFSGVGMRKSYDVIDVSDPYNPTRLFEIDVSRYGDDPAGAAAMKGIAVLTVKNDEHPERGAYVLFYNVDGEMLADPINLESANRVLFTNDGRRVLVTMPGAPNPDDYSQNPEGGLAVIDLGVVNWGACRQGRSKCKMKPAVSIIGFTGFNSQKDELLAAGVRIVSPGATVAQDLEPEGLTVSQDGHDAWVTFERSNAVGHIDLEAGKLVGLFTAGSRDHRMPGFAFDASDKDGVNIKNWPVTSLAQPDGIAVYSFQGKRYLAMANEGDPHDAPSFGEKARVRDVPLDPVSIPDGAVLRDNKQLGRLQVTTIEGDPDRDGDLDAFYMLGSRSFSIFSEDGDLVYDSGDDFERITAAALPSYFNCADDENKADARSDDRGPEPEHLALATVDGRVYAITVFERIGGMMVYDVTNPYETKFVQYVNNRNFAVEPKAVCGTKGAPEAPTCHLAGDLEPEGAAFVSAADSPIGAPLVILNHELSDTVTVYRVDRR